MACLTLAAHLGPPPISVAVGDAVRGVGDLAATAIAQVVVGLALLLDGGGLAVAPSVSGLAGPGGSGAPGP